MSKPFIAYTRVSTQKQGSTGVSLQELRQAIIRYANKEGLHISAWHEETETAAKSGRREFRGTTHLFNALNKASVDIDKMNRVITDFS